MVQCLSPSWRKWGEGEIYFIFLNNDRYGRGVSEG